MFLFLLILHNSCPIGLRLIGVRRKFESLVSEAVGQEGVKRSGPLNLASVRLARTIAQMARQFLQTNLPPLRALPTVQQYDSLAAQRKDELTARWEEEDRVLAQVSSLLLGRFAQLRIQAMKVHCIYHTNEVVPLA